MRLQRIEAVAGRLARALDVLAKIYLVLLVLAVLFLMTGQAVDRYALHTTFDAYEQLASVGVVWITFYGFALGFRDERNLRIELLNGVLPPWLNTLRRIVFDLVILGLSLVINITGWPVLGIAATQGIIGTPFTNAIAYASLQFGSGLLCLFCLLHLVRWSLALVGQRRSLAPHSLGAVPPAV